MFRPPITQLNRTMIYYYCTDLNPKTYNSTDVLLAYKWLVALLVASPIDTGEG